MPFGNHVLRTVMLLIKQEGGRRELHREGEKVVQRRNDLLDQFCQNGVRFVSNFDLTMLLKYQMGMHLGGKLPT